jgi:H+/gluconate symporter-like permease
MGRINQFIGHVAPGVIRPLRVLWNEIIGFVFICLAALPTPTAIRLLRNYKADGETLLHAVLTVSFVVLMTYFGVTSFLRARKISRS